MYLFSTENIRENYPLLPIRGKTVLVACGSGDQVLDLLLYKPKKIIAFDLNANAKHTLDLKMAAIKAFDLKEFNSFFNDDSRSLLSYRMYAKLRHHLPTDSRRYFDGIYSENDMNGKEVYKTRFRSRSYRTDSNRYTGSERCYAQLKRLVDTKLRFVLSDVLELHKNNALRLQRFDLIYLSNIPPYLRKPDSFRRSVVFFFNDIVLANLSKLLKENGIIAYCEVYSFFKHGKGIPEVVTQKAIKEIKELGDFEIEQDKVHGQYDRRRYDILVRLTPVEKQK